MYSCKVSICLITYNHEKYIRQTIESILAQENLDSGTQNLALSMLNQLDMVIGDYNIDHETFEV